MQKPYLLLSPACAAAVIQNFSSKVAGRAMSPFAQVMFNKDIGMGHKLNIEGKRRFRIFMALAIKILTKTVSYNPIDLHPFFRCMSQSVYIT